MKTLILTLIPVSVLAVSAFLLALIWFRKSPDRLVAHNRLLVIAMCLLAGACIGMALTSFDFGLLVCFGVVIVVCEYERRRLSPPQHERQK
jgi:multisubunit Na+/H+ antiporter MnhF subunit